jgi:hypothetical protein
MIPAEIERSLSREKANGYFELSTATTQDQGQRRLAYAQLEFGRRDLRPPRAGTTADYGSLLLKRAQLSMEEGTELVSQLYGGAQLALEELTSYSPMSGQYPPVTFLSSRSPFYGFNREWPLHYSEFAVPNNARAGPIGSVLAKPNLPLYPTSGEAIREFFRLGGGRNWTFNDYGKLHVIIPDYRARIEEFKIGYHRVSLRVTAGTSDPDILRCKMYLEDPTTSASTVDMKLDDGVACVEPPFDPTRVLAVLMDGRDGTVIDQRDWFPGYVYPAYAQVERPEQQIRDLIAAGEGKRIEFKAALTDRDDFLETVVAFANSEGGLILLGINDNRVPVGFKGDKDSISKMIRDTCEPTIEPSFKEYELDGFPVLAVEIPIGQDKPYMLRYKGIIYVRIGPNDVPASRLDVDQLTTQTSSKGHFGVVWGPST